jgi:hypothetical protein
MLDSNDVSHDYAKGTRAPDRVTLPVVQVVCDTEPGHGFTAPESDPDVYFSTLASCRRAV